MISPENYFQLRQNSEALKVDGSRFEGLPWAIVRETDGWRMIVSRVEGDVECCIIAPDGTSKSYA